MSSIQTSEAIEAWKRAHRFVLDLYRMTNRLPVSEQTGLTPKVRTSVVKVASNIVEGYARKSDADYLRHLSESQVALEETKYSLLVIRDLGYISESDYDLIMVQAEDVSERLTAMHAKMSVTEATRAPQAELPEPTASLPASGDSSFKKTARDLWNWVKGGTTRLKREDEPRIWAEDPPLPNYLEEASAYQPDEPVVTSSLDESFR